MHYLEGLVAGRSLVGEVVLDLAVSSAPINQSHHRDLAQNVLLEEGDGGHEECNGNAGTTTPEDGGAREGTQEPDVSLNSTTM